MKKKVLLTGAIIWGVIALAILVLFVLGMTGNLNIPGIFTRGGSSVVFASNTELVKEESFSASSLSKLDISTSHHSIYLTLTDSDTITVRQYDADADNLFTATQSGGSLSIKIQPRTVIGIMSFNFNPRLEIELPEAYAADMALSSGSGSITCSPDRAIKWGDTSISTNSGTIRLNPNVSTSLGLGRLDLSISCGTLSISTGSGSVNLGDAQASQISVVTNSGTQRLGELKSVGDISLKSGSGSINTGDISASDFDVKTNSGTIRLEEINATGAVTLGSGSGSINCGDMSAKSADVSSNSGTLRLSGIKADGTVSISSGSGSHTVALVTCLSYEISSNSGTLNYEGISGYGSIKTGSGSITCRELDVKGSGTITSNSGTVRIDLADNQNFEIEINTNSGSIRTDDDLDLMYKNQKGNNAFGTIGNGSNGTLVIKTGSGSVNVN